MYDIAIKGSFRFELHEIVKNISPIFEVFYKQRNLILPY